MTEALLAHASTDALLLRRLQPEDYANGYCALISGLTEVGDLTEEKFLEAYAYISAHPDHYYDVVAVDRATGQLAGNGRLLIEQKFYRGCALKGYVEDIVVCQTHRQQGLGSLIIKTLLDIAKLRGCYRLGLHCKPELMGFYERLGFQGGSSHMSIYLPGKDSV
mmetsp:Transcript_29284/g.52428  ORF Transcript_29284/g.52428 Transcript_29284/m.52428 type:complete len:164 (-) Transcript_29284:484-975(-)